MEKAEELVSSGERLLRGRHYLHLDCVAPKCEELQRMSVTLADRLQRRSEFLAKCRELQESVDKVSSTIPVYHPSMSNMKKKSEKFDFSN